MKNPSSRTHTRLPLDLMRTLVNRRSRLTHASHCMTTKGLEQPHRQERELAQPCTPGYIFTSDALLAAFLPISGRGDRLRIC